MLLGKDVAYPQKYDPSILYRIERRRNLNPLNFHGFDRWFCYELSFLLENGCPYCCGLEILVPAESRYMVESKSLKLYLGSLAFERFRTVSDCPERIIEDLKQLLDNADVTARLIDPKEENLWQVKALPGLCIDSIDINCSEFSLPQADFLQTEDLLTEEILHSNLFRSLCPVTGQPDSASVVIRYKGQKIKHSCLLQYLVSYRNHNDFHESCCERIYSEISEKCRCQNLTVGCFFTRRGGIEINPLRSSDTAYNDLKTLRAVRQ